jgi:hypothetical protein
VGGAEAPLPLPPALPGAACWRIGLPKVQGGWGKSQRVGGKPTSPPYQGGDKEEVVSAQQQGATPPFDKLRAGSNLPLVRLVLSVSERGGTFHTPSQGAAGTTTVSCLPSQGDGVPT